VTRLRKPVPILTREEAEAIMWLLADMLAELKQIRRLLDDGEEEEEGLE
jgi:hypothetical protein